MARPHIAWGTAAMMYVSPLLVGLQFASTASSELSKIFVNDSHKGVKAVCEKMVPLACGLKIILSPALLFPMLLLQHGTGMVRDKLRWRMERDIVERVEHDARRIAEGLPPPELGLDDAYRMMADSELRLEEYDFVEHDEL